MRLQGVTVFVRELGVAKEFYEDVLGFRPSMFYDQTAWQAYEVQAGCFFAIQQASEKGTERGGLVEFFVEDVECLWQQVNDQVQVSTPLRHTPWGSYKFIINDPDGNALSFVQLPKPSPQ